MPGTFEESKHPRAQDGKFGQGGGGVSGQVAAPTKKARVAARAARPVAAKSARAKAAAVNAKAKTLVSDARTKAKGLVTAASAKRAAALGKARASGRKLTPAAKAKIAGAHAKAKDKAKSIVEKAKAKALAMKAKVGAGKPPDPRRRATKTAGSTGKAPTRTPVAAPAPVSRPAPRPTQISKEEHQARAESQLGSLSHDEAKAVNVYQGPAYSVINPELRKTGGTLAHPELRAIADNIDAAIRKHRLPHDQQLFRGMRGDQMFRTLGAMKPGQVFQDHGFVSTSSDAEVGGFGQLKMVIAAPKGARGLHMRGHEREVLLPRGSRFRIEKIEHGSLPSGGRPIPTLTAHVTLLADDQ